MARGTTARMQRDSEATWQGRGWPARGAGGTGWRGHVAGRPRDHVGARVGRDASFSCVVKTQRRWSNKIYKTELTKTRYNNQVLGKYQVDPHRAGLTLIAELTWSNLEFKRVLNERK